MDRVDRSVRRHVERAAGMERFVRLVVGGGVALVAGLWAVALVTPGSPLRPLGAGLTVLGVGTLAAGIGSEIEW